MDNFLMMFFGKTYFFFNMRNNIQADIWATESELELSRKRIFEKQKNIEELKLIVEEQKHEDGTPIIDPKEIEMIKEEILIAEQFIKLVEGNVATRSEQVRQAREKLVFMNEYAPKKGKFIFLCVVAIAVIAFVL